MPGEDRRHPARVRHARRVRDPDLHDRRGGRQHAPVIGDLPDGFLLTEGVKFSLALDVYDLDGDGRVVFSDGLPPGARFDVHGVFEWTPGFQAPAPTPTCASSSPTAASRRAYAQLRRAAGQRRAVARECGRDRTVREGDPIRLHSSRRSGRQCPALHQRVPAGGRDARPGHRRLTMDAGLRRGRRVRHSRLGDGRSCAQRSTLRITVHNENGAPVFDGQDGWTRCSKVRPSHSAPSHSTRTTRCSGRKTASTARSRN